LIYKRYKLITKAIGWGIEGIDAIKTIEAIEMDKYGFATLNYSERDAGSSERAESSS
jgi:hypothetical protein